MDSARSQKFSMAWARLGRLAVAVAFVAVACLAGNSALMWFGFSGSDGLAATGVPLVLIIFVLAAAVPFVPGAEIGLALLVVFGADIVLEVYLAMITALLLAYGVGRTVPGHRIEQILAWISPHRPAGLQSRPAPGNRTGHLVGTLARNRHLVLALALNTPGNAVLGGGGGLAMAAGASRLISPRSFLLTVAIAVAPVPLCIATLDRLGLSWSLL